MRSQDPQDYAGKTLRLRDDGSIPRDNPFVNDARYLPAIYTLGHRNGHSMTLNPWTSELWVTEQGPNGGDEINVLRPGGNYGWPIKEGSFFFHMNGEDSGFIATSAAVANVPAELIDPKSTLSGAQPEVRTCDIDQ